MFTGTEDDLKQTNVTQPAVFLHSIIAYKSINDAKPEMVAGHSLGEFSALVVNGTLSFEDALRLVSIRAKAMQKACEINPSTMAAVLALADEKVEEICAAVQEETGEIVVPANYNCPGQLVISGTIKGIDIACERMKAAGAKRALVIPVGGAFHSPLMEPAKNELQAAIESTRFHRPVCHIYQNVVAKAVIDNEEIKKNLIEQLTGPVRWTQSVQAMIADGASQFTEIGPGKVLQGLILKIDKSVTVSGQN
jgi:[acyl-carrier-protein] S-malonyltransferase